VDKLFAAGSKLDCVYAIQRLSLTGVTEVEVTSFVEKFVEVIDSTPDSKLPSNELMRKLVLACIRNPVFRTRMDVALEEEPEVEDCIRVLYEEAAMVKEVLDEARKYTQTRSGGASTQSSSSRIRCFYCKKLGHREAECRKKKRDQTAVKPEPSTSTRLPFKEFVKTVTCSRCGQKGHYANRCPSQRGQMVEFICSGEHPGVLSLVDTGSTANAVSSSLLAKLSPARPSPLEDCHIPLELADGRVVTSNRRAWLSLRIRGALGKPLVYSGWFIDVPMSSSTQFPVLLGEPFIRETSWFSEGLPSLPEVIADFEEDEIAVPVATEDTGSFDLSGTAPELMDAVKKLTSQYEAKSRKVGICKGDPVEIVVTDTHPVNCPPRRLSPDRREALQLLIDDLLARGAI
ncbi:hypothetical protein ADUPG1_006203, partial [Aduncisulcus paluster]